jgi:endonuclease/exonuclease/phosphatase family metal-dependent hydrolase
MTMPYAQILCFISLIYWIFQRAKRALLPLIVLVLGYGFIQRSIAFQSPKASLENSVKVLDYNVYGMFSNTYEGNEDNLSNLKKFMRDYNADIKCFQEFYSNPGRKQFRSVDYMKDAYPHYAFIPLKEEDYDKNEKMGIAIFSKYPIINKIGKQFDNTSNGYLMTDIAMMRDTIRVINLQLWSMGIRVGKVTGKIREQDYEDAKKESRGILASLKKGFIHHKKEMDQINRLIQQSPYPIIVAGDLNETPYGWAYGTIRERLKNAFEEAGNGLGFTLNRSPYFVRIDNQFFSDDWEILQFKTLTNIKYSDHFPVFAEYTIKK